MQAKWAGSGKFDPCGARLCNPQHSETKQLSLGGFSALPNSIWPAAAFVPDVRLATLDAIEWKLCNKKNQGGILVLGHRKRRRQGWGKHKREMGRECWLGKKRERERELKHTQKLIHVSIWLCLSQSASQSFQFSEFWSISSQLCDCILTPQGANRGQRCLRGQGLPVYDIINNQG